MGYCDIGEEMAVKDDFVLHFWELNNLVIYGELSVEDFAELLNLGIYFTVEEEISNAIPQGGII